MSNAILQSKATSIDLARALKPAIIEFYVLVVVCVYPFAVKRAMGAWGSMSLNSTAAPSVRSNMPSLRIKKNYI